MVRVSAAAPSGTPVFTAARKPPGRLVIREPTSSPAFRAVKPSSVRVITASVPVTALPAEPETVKSDTEAAAFFTGLSVGQAERRTRAVIREKINGRRRKLKTGRAAGGGGC
jgi:hypothetical protein